jgi:hypothetical protein
VVNTAGLVTVLRRVNRGAAVERDPTRGCVKLGVGTRGRHGEVPAWPSGGGGRL